MAGGGNGGDEAALGKDILVMMAGGSRSEDTSGDGVGVTGDGEGVGDTGKGEGAGGTGDGAGRVKPS